MNWMQRFIKSNFFTRLTHWEYWPFGILQGPVFVYWLWLSLKARSFFFFSASNPGILSGGMMGESKFEVLRKVPAAIVPKTLLVKLPTDKNTILKILRENKISLPVIFKPDLGERGWLVKRIDDDADIEPYLKKIKIDFLIQQYVDLPQEYGVFYYRLPGEDHGVVSSITAKEFLSVTGDGRRTLEQLIMENSRARLQLKALEEKFRADWNTVLPAGDRWQLVPIGNHVLGTKFINANHLITPKLNATFDHISKQIDGFFFGRFDLRCATTKDLETGNIQVVELNGCGAEPAHIYDPDFSFWRAMAVLFRHVRCMYDISTANHQRGVPYLSFREGRRIYSRFQALKAL
jgi:hypothetical protein